MSVAFAVTHAAAALLIVSGATKLRRPASVTTALRALGLPSGAVLAAGVGAAEAALGLAVLIAGGPALAALLAAAYAAFAAVVVRLRRRDATAPCGCFGDATPPSGTHLVVNGVLAATAVMATTGKLPPLLSTIGDQPLAGVPYLLLLATSTYCLYALLSVLPAVQRPGVSGHQPVVREFSVR